MMDSLLFVSLMLMKIQQWWEISGPQKVCVNYLLYLEGEYFCFSLTKCHIDQVDICVLCEIPLRMIAWLSAALCYNRH